MRILFYWKYSLLKGHSGAKPLQIYCYFWKVSGEDRRLSQDLTMRTEEREEGEKGIYPVIRSEEVHFSLTEVFPVTKASWPCSRGDEDGDLDREPYNMNA